MDKAEAQDKAGASNLGIKEQSNLSAKISPPKNSSKFIIHNVLGQSSSSENEEQRNSSGGSSEGSRGASNPKD